jgi:hypothetical protein
MTLSHLKRFRLRIGASGLALLAIGAIIVGLVTIPVQAQEPTDGPSESYYYVPSTGAPLPGGLPASGQGQLDGTGGRLPLIGGDSAGRDMVLPVAGATVLLALGASSLGLSFWLNRRS